MILATLFIPLAVIIYILLRPSEYIAPPKIQGSWKRDLEPHEVKYYNELRKHWRRQARLTYKKLHNTK